MAEPTPALPDLYEGTLDVVLLRRLGTDLETCTDVDHVQVRDAGSGPNGDRRTSLATAMELLASGDVRTVQIRYRHAGADWCDTLIAQPAGDFRLVRMQSNPSMRNHDVEPL